MERLTERKYGNIVSKREEGTGILCSSFCNNCSQGTGNCKYVKEMVGKLAEYEDLEEQGLMLRLPCKVGSTVYMIDQYQRKILQKEIKQISFNNHGNWAVYAGACVVPFDDFGKTVFLTQAEAEEALKEQWNDN